MLFLVTQAHFVRPVEGIPGLREFLKECTAFPHGSNNDMVDALTQFLKWSREHAPKPDPIIRMIRPPGRHGLLSQER